MGTGTVTAVAVVVGMGTPVTMRPRSITPLVRHSTTDAVGVTLRELTTVGVEQAGAA